MKHLRQVTTLLFSSALLLACGDDSSTDDGVSEQKADGGTSTPRADAGSKPSSSGNAVVYTGTPTCAEASGLQLQGTIDGTSIDETRPLGSAQRLDTSLRTLDRNNDPDDYDGTDENLKLSWDSKLTKGQVSTIGAGAIRFPMKMDLGPYCVAAGKIGYDPSQPSEGYRLQFVITSVRKQDGESCTGPELAAELKGCMTLFGVNES